MEDQRPIDDAILRLIVRAKVGDNDALGELLNRHRGLLISIARYELSTGLRSKEGESDIVQQATYKALESFDQFDGSDQTQLKNWLRTILKHVVLDRRCYYDADKRQIENEKPLDADAGQNIQLAASDPSPSEILLKKEEKATVEAAIRTLNDTDRKIVEMRYLEYYSIPEIAHALNLTPAATSQRCYRALEELKRKVRPDDQHSAA